MKKNLVRHLIAMLVICAMLMVGAGMVFANAEDIEYITMFADGTVNVYEAADTESQVVCQLQDADSVKVYELDEDWYITESDTFIRANDLRKEQYPEEPEEEAEVVEEPVVVAAPVVAEAPVVEGPVAEAPAAEKPVAEEPATEEPMVEEPVAEAPAAEKPVAEEPATEEPMVEESVAEAPAAEKPVAEEPVAEEPVAEAPAAEEPADEEPAAEEPVAEEPADEEPVADEPATEEPVDKEPAAEEPVAEEAVEEEPVAEEETVEETTAEEAPEAEDVINEESAAEEKVTEAEPAPEELETAETGDTEPADAEPTEAEEETAEDELVEIEENETPLGIIEIVTLYTVDTADVRLEADELSGILTTLDKGAAVTTVGQEGSWTRVVIGDQIGFVFSDLLAASLPEEETVAEPVAETAEETAEEPVTGTAQLPEKKVDIFSSRCTVMTEGDYVLLSSKIEGFDGLDIIYQWECDQGNGFQPVENANNDTYAFRASTESLSWDWRLTVYYR